MSDNTKAISRVKTGLVLDHPFFGALALAAPCGENPGIERSVVDGDQLIINPEKFLENSLDQQKGEMAAAYLSMGLGHPFRRGARNEKRWTMASNVITGIQVKASGMNLPKDWPTHPRFNTETTVEAGYKILEEEQSDGDDDGDDEQNGGPGGGRGGYDVDKPGNPPPNNDGEGQGDGSGDGQGQGQGGGQAPSPAEMKAKETEWKVKLAQAAQAAKAMGKLPANIAAMVGEALEAKIPWQQVLRDFVEKVEHDDYTWTRPNRRWLQQGLILPSLHNQDIGDIIVAFDTSGSVSARELKQFFGELTSILEDFPGATCTLIEADARVSNVRTFTHDDLPIDGKVSGRGGTSFQPPFNWIEENVTEDFACFIYLTDGECDDYPAAPAYPVLWVFTQEPGGSSWCKTPPFGSLTVID